MKHLLLALMALLALSTPSFADETGKCGDNITWTLSTTTNTLTLAGSGSMWDFAGCPFGSADITTVVIQSGITSIGANAFSGLTHLTSVRIPSTVTSIGSNSFYKCETLPSISIPGSVTTIGEGAFDRCETITSVKLPNSVTTLGKNAFYACFNLKDVTLSNSLTRINMSTFGWCRSLKTIVIPNSVTRLESSVFDNCTGLTTITLGSSLTDLGEYLFNQCSSLKTVYTKAAEPPICDICVFEGVDRDNALLFVPETPDTSLDLYKNAKSWRLFKNIFSIEMPAESNDPKNICDTNRDGLVNAADVVRIYNYIINGQ